MGEKERKTEYPGENRKRKRLFLFCTWAFWQRRVG